MGETRLEKLQEMVRRKPLDPFAQYALAMEYLNLDKEDQSLVVFESLLQAHEDYIPAYFQLGQLLVERGDLDQAREIFQKGIGIAEAKGDSHSASELKDALDLL